MIDPLLIELLDLLVVPLGMGEQPDEGWQMRLSSEHLREIRDLRTPDGVVVHHFADETIMGVPYVVDETAETITIERIP